MRASHDHLPLRHPQKMLLAHLHAARMGLLVVAGGAALCGLGGCQILYAGCNQSVATQAACITIQGSTLSTSTPLNLQIPVSPTGGAGIPLPLAAQPPGRAPAMGVNSR